MPGPSFTPLLYCMLHLVASMPSQVGCHSSTAVENRVELEEKWITSYCFLDAPYVSVSALTITSSAVRIIKQRNRETLGQGERSLCTLVCSCFRVDTVYIHQTVICFKWTNNSPYLVSLLYKFSKLRRCQLKLAIPGQSQVFFVVIMRHGCDEECTKLRCFNKRFFVFYEPPCLTVPISKGVWPAFSIPIFLFFPAVTLAPDHCTNCTQTHTHPNTHTHTHTASTRFTFGVSLA